MDSLLKELKEKLLQMFRVFHQICEENGLRYYALGGTMLGAVRHGGFIPWDDDIDVGMPRADYERLCEILSREENGRYVLETAEHSASDYFYPYGKLYDTQTTLVENTKYKIKRGIFIDIFPLDGIGDSQEESHRNFRSVKASHNFLLCRTTGQRKGRKWYKNLAARLMQFLPFVNNKKLLMRLCDKCKRLQYDDCEFVGNLVGAWGERELFPKSRVGHPCALSL